MSLTIIFETKFVKLKDGRLLHLDRSGCNNDNAGRDLSDFTGKIYTEKELKEKAESYMKDGKSGYWELKIGSKYSTYYDYGEHLLRMAKRAIPFNEFMKERRFYAERYDGVELLEPEVKKMTPNEFDEYWYNSRGSFSWKRLTTILNSEDDIIQSLENKEPVSFYVGKRYKVVV